MSEIALTSWPLDNKEYTAEALGAAFAARSRGVLHATDFAAAVNGDNTVTLSPGAACLHVTEFWGTFPYLLQKTILDFEDADGLYPRWDAISLVYDKNLNEVRLESRTGTAEPYPSLPELRRDSDYDEIILYRVTRPHGATKISADDIVDLRLDTSYCGLMRDMVDRADTSVMQAAFEAFLSKIEAELAMLYEDSAAMTKMEYDPMGGGASITVQPYTCEKSGTVYELTGTGAVGRCKIPAAWESGDTWSVNGKTVPAYCGADAVDGDCIVAGRWVLFTFDGQRLDFNGGGGLSASKLAQATAASGDVLAGKSFFAADKTLKTGTLALSGTAGVGDVLRGVTFYNTDAKSKQTGTLALSGTAAAGDVISGKTFYNTAAKTKVTGTLALSGTANAAQVLSGYTCYKTDPKTKITGTMTNRGAVSATVAPGGSYTILAGYHNGSGKVTGSYAGVLIWAFFQSSANNGQFNIVGNPAYGKASGYSFTFNKAAKCRAYFAITQKQGSAGSGIKKNWNTWLWGPHDATSGVQYIDFSVSSGNSIQMYCSNTDSATSQAAIAIYALS